jgi:lactate dehydrogenase-like 2-hydroxyacid dehydrogenase
MTTIGIVGSGHVGSNLAKAAVAQGYEVVMSNSRGPQTLAGLAAKLGLKAKAAVAAEAAAAGDFAIVAIPLTAIPRDVPDDQGFGRTGTIQHDRTHSLAHSARLSHCLPWKIHPLKMVLRNMPGAWSRSSARRSARPRGGRPPGGERE